MNKIYLYIIAIAILTFILGFLIGTRCMIKFLIKRLANNIAKAYKIPIEPCMEMAINILEGRFSIGKAEK